MIHDSGMEKDTEADVLLLVCKKMSGSVLFPEPRKRMQTVETTISNDENYKYSL